MPAFEHRSPIAISAGSNRTIRVLQITDPHLMAKPSGTLLGVNTRESLAAVVSHAQCNMEAPDVLLATGDLAQDGSEQAYDEFASQVSIFDCPKCWVPGNHDDAETLDRVARRHHAAGRQILAGQWQIIMLDSAVAGQVHGYLGETEMAFLESCLTEYPELPALISLHHHPVEIGTRWMENIGLYNREAFWAVVDRYPNVRVVLWGHIHQDLDSQRGDVLLLATPSTCIQFEAGSDDFSVEHTPPGYRWLELHPDGSLATGVVRATGFTYDLDTESNGY